MRSYTGYRYVCGICGIVDFAGSAVDAQTVSAMARTLSHRGPDDSGAMALGAAGLGHTRLSIIDLTVAGRQPMQTRDGRYTLVYNGELYNHPTLRRELEQHGARFRGTSDTEVLLEALRIWWTDAIPRLKGMFAFAVWDSAEQELLLARDRFGIKPLYIQRTSSGVVFGSEVKAILAARRGDHRPSPQGVHEYLYFGNALGRTTLFDGIDRVLPGTFLQIREGDWKESTYWSLSSVTEQRVPFEEARSRVLELLSSAVEAHLISDVPIGVFLSGGIDSSAITALAARYAKTRLKTYSVSFDFTGEVNELACARRVASLFHTDHEEVHIEGASITGTIEKLIRCHDEPFGDAANIPLYLLCERLAGERKVILQGDGGDEIFAGYRRYNVLSYPGFWRGVARRSAACAAARTRAPARTACGPRIQVLRPDGQPGLSPPESEGASFTEITGDQGTTW